MLKLNKDQKRQPIGGHQYHESGVTFKGDTFEQVVANLTAFRRFNCLPTGNPDQDVLLYYLNHWPFMVKEDRNAVQPVFSSEFTEWRDWVVGLWNKPPKKMLAIKEAKERWKICLDCPMNKKKGWIETNESAELTKRAFMLRRGAEVPEQLNFCSCHKADLSVFPFLDSPSLYSAMKDGKKPEACWV